MNLAIMEESPLVRVGIEHFVLSLYQAVHCVARVGSVHDLLSIPGTQPFDLLVSELAGEQETTRQGVDGLLQLCHHRPDIRQIIYTYSRSGELLYALRRFPQVSLISREETEGQTEAYFLQALTGLRVCSSLIQQTIDQYARKIEAIALRLTPSEYQVLGYLFRGESMAGIASRLKRSIKTISAHKRNAMHKLGVDNDAGLFSFRQTFLPQQTDSAGK